DAPFLTSFASAGPMSSPVTLTISGNPNSTGRFTIRWSAQDAAGAEAEAGTTLFIAGPDRAPFVNTPDFIRSMETKPIQFAVGVTDPDGNAITSLTASGTAINAGAAFTPNATKSGGTFSWTPSLRQAGFYTA